MNFNWSIIKENYNNAYLRLLDEEDLTEGNNSGSLYDPQTDSEYNLRKLYDFFDSKEIDCFIVPGTQGFEKIPWILHSFKGEAYESRAEAEAKLFTKAFELLEQKLSNPVISFA